MRLCISQNYSHHSIGTFCILREELFLHFLYRYINILYTLKCLVYILINCNVFYYYLLFISYTQYYYLLPKAQYDIETKTI